MSISHIHIGLLLLNFNQVTMYKQMAIITWK